MSVCLGVGLSCLVHGVSFPLCCVYCGYASPTIILYQRMVCLSIACPATKLRVPWFVLFRFVLRLSCGESRDIAIWCV
jgi:hypothetical protein